MLYEKLVTVRVLIITGEMSYDNNSSHSNDGWLSVSRQIQIEASRAESRMETEQSTPEVSPTESTMQTEQSPPERWIHKDLLAAMMPYIEQPQGV